MPATDSKPVGVLDPSAHPIPKLIAFAVSQVLLAETDDVRPFARLLRGVGFNSRANVTVQQAGLQVQVDEGRTMSASAYVLANLFNKWEFNYNPKRIRPPSSQDDDDDDDDNDNSNDRNLQDTASKSFDVNLNTLLECLNIYGNATTPIHRDGPTFTSIGDEGGGGGGWKKRRWAGGDDDEKEDEKVKEIKNTGLIMEWKGDGWPLVLILKDEDPKSPTTVCKLSLLEPEEMMNEDFEEEDMVVHIIMKSTWLREAISDLDSSCSRLTVIARPEMPRNILGGSSQSYNPRTERERSGMFRLEAVGNFGKTELDYPNDKDVMDCFKCLGEIRFSYNFATFSLANRALQASIKVSLRIDHEGFMSLQLMMPQPANKRIAPTESGIIEFKFRPLEDE